MARTSLAEQIARRLVSWRWLLLGLGLVAMFWSWWPAQRLSFDRSIENMFAADDPLLPPYRKLQRTFGGDEVVLAAYVDEELFTDRGFARLAKLTERLERVPGVDAAASLTTIPFASPDRPDSRLIQTLEGYLVGADRQTAAVVCLLEDQQETSVPREATIDGLRKIVRAHEASGVIAGEPVMVVDGFRHLAADGWRLRWTTMGLLVLVMIGFFRSVRWVIIPVVVVQAAMMWTEAALVLTGLRLSMVSSMLAAIITVIGVATVVHVVVRFREARQGDERSPREALVAAGALVLLPVFWSCLTDAAGFGALLTARVGPVQDFGVMMALGAAMVLLAVPVILPGLALAGRLDTDPQRAWGEGKLEAGLRGLLGALLRRPRSYAAALLAFSSAVAVGCFWLEVETDFTRNFREDSPVVESYEFVESRLGGAAVWDVVVPAPEQIDTAYLDKVRRLEERLRTEVQLEVQGERQPGLTKVLSLPDVVDASPVAGLSWFPGVREAALAQTLRVLESQLPVIARSLHAEDPQQPGSYYLRIMLRSRERQPAEQKQALIEQVRRISREEFPEAEVTGFFVLLTNLVGSMLRDQWVTFGVASAAIWLMMLLAFRSPLVSLVAVIPNALPILIVTGLMGWLGELGYGGFKINMGGAMIAAVSIGLSVDSSVHYLAAFARHRRAGAGVDESLHAVQQSVGRAVIFSTLALVIGFSALLVSEFVPTIYFGALVSLAMLGGLLGNLLLLPLLLKITTREGRAIT